MSPLHRWARWYAEQGWAVFPLVPGTKSPFKGSNGSSEATCDLAQVDAWWEAQPDANIGCRPGTSCGGLYVFDVDPRNGGLESFADLELLHGPIGSPLRVDSPSGGWHFYFKAPAGPRYDTLPGKGIDGKYNGYAVLPPSRHPFGGRYAWSGQPRAADAPLIAPWLERPVVERPERAERAEGDLSDLGAIREALGFLSDDADFRGDAWLEVAMAIHHWEHVTEGADEAGWEVFEEWCLRDPSGSYDEKVRRRWDSFNADRDDGTTIGTLFHRASLKGWSRAGSRLSDEAVARIFGGAVAPAWLPADPAYRGETDPNKIAARMVDSGKVSGSLNGLVRQSLWNSGLDCEVAAQVCKTLCPAADDELIKAAVAAQRPAMTEFRGKPVEWARAPDISGANRMHLEDLVADPISTNANDHYVDAHGLMKETFQHRLASFSQAPYWWDGRRWSLAADAILRRHIGAGLHDGESKLSSPRISGTLTVLKDQLPLMKPLNPATVLVFFRNCVLNAADGAVFEHRPDLRNSYLLDCDYNPEASCDAWLAWLADIFESDRQRVFLLQEIFGWALVTDNLNIQKAVTLVGVPRGGKGTVLSVLTGILGEAAGAFQLADLVDDKVLAGMIGRNIAIDYDSASPDRKSARQVTGRFKAITANEPLAVRLLYTQTPFQGALNCKLLLAANSVPTLYDDSGASANRWVPLVFDKSFLGREDAGLADRLALEAEGIALWAVQGLQRLMESRQFTMPQTSVDELAGLLENASPYERFLDEAFEFGPDHRASEAEVWAAYTVWAGGLGMELGKRSHVMESVKNAARGRGARRTKSLRIGERVVRGFYGMALTGGGPPKSKVAYIR